MKKSALIFCIALFGISCQNNTKDAENIGSNMDTSYLDPDYPYVQLIPDSLRTPEQRALVDTLKKVIAENLVVENNKMVFKMTKEEFVSHGLPEEYYVLIQKDLVNNNEHFDSLDVNVEEILKNSLKNFE